MASSRRRFKDTSVDCAICLSPLSDGETIELDCGHVYHLACVSEQLEHSQPDRSRRLLFSGCRCAKCGTFCDHEALRHLTRRTDELREKVEALVAEQLAVDAPEVWRRSAGGERSRLVEEGSRTYAFYLCGSCDDPYFGGTVECADGEDGAGGGAELPNEDRLCPACSPRSQLVCGDPVRHRGSMVHKCRYCCRPSTHVCYGTVHFCQDCHDRNSARVREQRSRRGGAAPEPVPLEAVPCRGAECPHPKPDGQDRHSNGASHRCEQVYYCACCQSAPTTHAYVQELGSRNFVTNPSGERGLRGWRQLNPRISWAVEESDVPVDTSTRTNFVSSFQWCVMAQTVPLHRLVNDPSSVRVEVSAKFMARTDCPSAFRMEAIVLDSRRREICRKDTNNMEAPADFWERASLVIEPTRGAHDVVMVIYGKDGRFWRGNFGSKVAECSVRVLCAEDELANILRTADEAPNYPPIGNPVHARAGHRRAWEERWEEHQRAQGVDQWYRKHAYDILLPLAIILFVWIMSEG